MILTSGRLPARPGLPVPVRGVRVVSAISLMILESTFGLVVDQASRSSRGTRGGGQFHPSACTSNRAARASSSVGWAAPSRASASPRRKWTALARVENR
jgi:hypothetical protein